MAARRGDAGLSVGRPIGLPAIACIVCGAFGVAVGYIVHDRHEPSLLQPASPFRARPPHAAPAENLASESRSSFLENPADQRAESSNVDVAHLSAQTLSADADVRAAAIIALSSAPKAEAIAPLRRALEGGEPLVDRPLALRSLRDLALHQGDENGAIRTIVRETLYHADDAALLEHAQLALEVIEESELRLRAR